MQKQPIGGNPDRQDRRTQRLLLALVIDKKQRPWSVDEIVRTLEGTCSRPHVEDALAQLRAVGLINQADKLVFASQAAAHIERLGMLSV
jgi:hypothetical protein